MQYKFSTDNYHIFVLFLIYFFFNFFLSYFVIQKLML